MDRFVRDKSVDLGRLRLTMAQFFRINGGSTQHRGVVPDIIFPTADSAKDQGERGLDNALPWASIQPAHYQAEANGFVSTLRERHRQRIDKDPGFRLLLAQEDLLKEIRDQKEVSLLESRRKAERDAREKASLDSKNQFRTAHGMAPITEEADTDPDAEPDEKEQEAVKRIQVDEAARILSDFIGTERPLTAMH